MMAWLEVNALLVLLIVFGIIVVLDQIQIHAMRKQHAKEIREMRDRLMSRNLSEYAVARVAMGEAESSSKKDKEASDAVENASGLLDEEMGYSAHGPYYDEKGNEIAPMS